MATDKIIISYYIPSLEIALASSRVEDSDVLIELRDKLKDKITKLNSKTSSGSRPDWNDFQSFWPPRLLSAYKLDKLIVFFGAGISMPSGLPSWNSLLTNYLKLDDKYTSDKELESDPLTLAEIASNFIGSENLQSILRSEFSKPGIKPVTNHYILASLRLPVYITTNYDELFEIAWKVINPTIELKVITNDMDFANLYVKNHMSNPQSDVSYLFKIHGCTSRKDEQLILTRKDYRLHYRSNEIYFDQIRQFLRTAHVLFAGFSHKDIEVTRLVEDAIYEYEKNLNNGVIVDQPNFYSLQFDMRTHTPEIFAAKGIVALEPPVTSLSSNYKSFSLNIALTELYLADYFNLDLEVSFETTLDNLKINFESELNVALANIKKFESKAIDSIKNRTNYTWLTKLLFDMADFANEGVYLCDDQGRVLEYEVPIRYNKTNRQIAPSTIFSDRPNFRQAKTFRAPFISDTFKSIYNDNSTFAVCLPIIENSKFKGLLFTACQIGNWNMPINEAKNIWASHKNLSFILIDSNGNCLLPPNNEFGLDPSDGYNFDKLFLLSKKDKVISRLIENVLPINKDDDVISITPNVKFYSLITELNRTRWKIGIATSIILNN